MSQYSSIEWTDASWVVVTGCEGVSPGCENCYAMRLAAGRLRHQAKYEGVAEMSSDGPTWTGEIFLHPQLLDVPLRWRKPRMIFVNSMSDTFHKDVPFGFVRRMFDTMEAADRHTFQVLTKRPHRMRYFVNRADKGELPNVWLGISVENADYKWRIEVLRETRAAVRFLSVEPLLGDIGDLDLNGIHWVIVGGESGPGARPMEASWVRNVRDQCLEQAVPFFFKQWGGVRKKKAGRVLDGCTWDQYPECA